MESDAFDRASMLRRALGQKVVPRDPVDPSLANPSHQKPGVLKHRPKKRVPSEQKREIQEIQGDGVILIPIPRAEWSSSCFADAHRRVFLMSRRLNKRNRKRCVYS